MPLLEGKSLYHLWQIKIHSQVSGVKCMGCGDNLSFTVSPPPKAGGGSQFPHFYDINYLLIKGLIKHTFFLKNYQLKGCIKNGYIFIYLY